MITKQKEFVFCVDSDGCAMDTMTYKHQLFFGPIAADIFAIDHREAFLKEWDRINLFSKTRGVNRFVGLVMGLEYANISGINMLKDWVRSTDSLSNASLEARLKAEPSQDLQIALDWSNEVNRHIRAYEGQALAFQGALEGLAKLKELGKVFVVSSANKEAVLEEWQEQGLMAHVDDFYCQDRGKKEDVIAQFIREGYDKDKIMMIGDSPGDLDAADSNDVAFFPILVGKEASFWSDLKEEVAPAFVEGSLSAVDLSSFKEAFWHNLA
ncbi:HAD family hydrolase [Streptococcus ictaluri]|uniref:Hydrolase, haloacid dehalogenase-like family protein n=1 Tax=Streptococcus ictaluri 707-05 TaxID=764299 RepID=G5K638_9STRE|nr:HAD hydrolase-like protein [Streptococcus ictaluri]EHI68633.1 hydrolase, haloacid dehalogenase-like family protein [Streptococcus ictaluri 707-05]